MHVQVKWMTVWPIRVLNKSSWEPETRVPFSEFETNSKLGPRSN